MEDDENKFQVILAQNETGDADFVLYNDHEIDTSLIDENFIFAHETNEEVTFQLTDLVSAGDLFGAETRPIMITENSVWFEPLTQNIFFDTELTYSSHEQITLNDQNTVYDGSPLDSLIFVENGNSSLTVTGKKADIFLGPQTETTINGDNAQINLFTTLDQSADFVLDGAFSFLSLNIYQSADTEFMDAKIIGDRMILGNDLNNSIDLSNVEFNGHAIEVNTYTDNGLINSTSLPFFNDPSEQAPSAPPALEPSIAISAEELLFSGELDTIEVKSSSDLGYQFDDGIDFTTWDDKTSEFAPNLELDVVELITEPQKLLDAGELFSDPLDVFDDIDFT